MLLGQRLTSVVCLILLLLKGIGAPRVWVPRVTCEGAVRNFFHAVQRYVGLIGTGENFYDYVKYLFDPDNDFLKLVALPKDGTELEEAVIDDVVVIDKAVIDDPAGINKGTDVYSVKLTIRRGLQTGTAIVYCDLKVCELTVRDLEENIEAGSLPCLKPPDDSPRKYFMEATPQNGIVASLFVEPPPEGASVHRRRMHEAKLPIYAVFHAGTILNNWLSTANAAVVGHTATSGMLSNDFLTLKNGDKIVARVIAPTDPMAFRAVETAVKVLNAFGEGMYLEGPEHEQPSGATAQLPGTLLKDIKRAFRPDLFVF